MHVDEHTIEVAGAPVFYRHRASAGTTVLYLHSVPTSSDDWLPFLELTGGLAPDLLGFGRSGKGGHMQYTLSAYVDFLEAVLDATETYAFNLVGHGWGGAIGLAFAQRHTDRVQRLAIIDAVPLLAGFQWPRIVRSWRVPAVGELLMGSASQRLLARALRSGCASPGAWPDQRVSEVWEQFDQGTQRAILRLHRSIEPIGLAAAGVDLDQLWAPALVAWGERDPWLPVQFADVYAERLPNAELAIVPEAGHWPWLDQPSLIDRIAEFATA